ncbi:MAG TPA: DUF6444 domain-containing protein [Ktedonobacteraceae bacterium]|nr:DUF6444 domain-containing protein [Ktedonobacteraceae bacterium]
MTQTENWDRLQAELKAWRDLAHEKHQEVHQLQHEKQMLREALAEAIQAIERLQEQTKDLEGQIAVLNDRVKMLDGQQAKDSHNSNLPPSSDRFVRRPKSLKQKSGKKPGGQPGHPGHHLKPVECSDTVVVHAVEQCEHCQRDCAPALPPLPSVAR